jgi:hypothetical protein
MEPVNKVLIFPLLVSHVGEHSGPAGEHAGSGSAHLLTPFEALSRVNRSRLAELLPFSFQSSPFSSSVGAFSLLIRVEVT